MTAKLPKADVLETFDLDFLRTLVAAVDAGSFAKAAARVGRTPSAISLQMRRLEEQAGQALVRKDGRGFALTTAGEVLVSYARRLLALSDEGLVALRGAKVEGKVRLGLPQDLAESRVTHVLSRFASEHSAVAIELRVDRNLALLDLLDAGRLDLALTFGAVSRSDAERLAQIPMTWLVASERLQPPLAGPIPLALFDPPCVFRSAALESLERAGRSWTVALTSVSLSALWAAVGAGLAITVRTAVGLPRSVRAVPAFASLPPLPSVALSLHTHPDARGAAVQHLAALLREAVPPSLAQGKRAANSKR